MRFVEVIPEVILDAAGVFVDYGQGDHDAPVLQVTAFCQRRDSIQNDRSLDVEQAFLSIGVQLASAQPSTRGESAKGVGEPPVFDVFFTNNEITDYRSTLTADKELLKRFNRLLLDRGVFKGDTKYYLSLAHTEDDLDQTFGAFSSAIDQLHG